MKFKKILITGGSGMVGSQINFGIKLSSKELDITKPISIEKAIKKYKPEVLIHLAAMTNMLGCEENPKQAHKINVLGTKNIAKACKKHTIKMVYMSTCAVFDGKKRSAYSEKDKTNPINIYGKTKLESEKVIQKVLPQALIVRTGWLFGGKKTDKKFIQMMYQRFVNNVEVIAVSDRYGSPTYVPDVIKQIQKLIGNESTGLYHVVNDGQVSYLEVAKEIKKLAKSKSKITSAKSKQFDSSMLKRAKMEALTSNKIKLRSWKMALKDYLI